MDYGKMLIQNADDFLEGKDFITKNKTIDRNAKYSRHKNKDRLDPAKQQRYDELLSHIDKNLNLILTEKSEYNKNIDS